MHYERGKSMKTLIEYFDMNTHNRSFCGDTLHIEQSSRLLGWEGVLLEKGTSPYFYPKHVETPTFYFALELTQKYDINVIDEEGIFSSQVQPDDIWFNPPFTPFTHNIEVPCDFIIVTITPERMERSFGSPLPDKLLFLNNYSLKDPILLKLIQLLYLEVISPTKNGTWYIDHIIALISNHVIRNYSNYNSLQSERSPDSFREVDFRTVDSYVDDHISEPIQIEQLADLVNMSKFYFLKEFKQFTAVTPYQYIIRKKINYSKRLLSETSDSITSIALELGFNDTSHFSRTFKQHEQLTPKQFRAQVQ